MTAYAYGYAHGITDFAQAKVDSLADLRERLATREVIEVRPDQTRLMLPALPKHVLDDALVTFHGYRHGGEAHLIASYEFRYPGLRDDMRILPQDRDQTPWRCGSAHHAHPVRTAEDCGEAEFLDRTIATARYRTALAAADAAIAARAERHEDD